MENSKEILCNKCNKKILSANLKIHDVQCTGNPEENQDNFDIMEKNQNNLPNQNNILEEEKINNEIIDINITSQGQTTENQQDISDLYFCPLCDNYMLKEMEVDHRFSHQMEMSNNPRTISQNIISNSINQNIPNLSRSSSSFSNLSQEHISNNNISSQSYDSIDNSSNANIPYVNFPQNSNARIVERNRDPLTGTITEIISGPGFRSVRNISSNSNIPNREYRNSTTYINQNLNGNNQTIERFFDPQTGNFTETISRPGFTNTRIIRNGGSNDIQSNNSNPNNFVQHPNSEIFNNFFQNGFPFSRIRSNPNSEISFNHPMGIPGERIRFRNSSRNDINNIFGLNGNLEELFRGILGSNFRLQQDHTALIDALPEMQVNKNSKIPEDKNECMICMSKFELEEKVKIMPCTHFFHTNCIREWFKSNDTCPICKNVVNQDLINGNIPENNN